MKVSPHENSITAEELFRIPQRQQVVRPLREASGIKFDVELMEPDGLTPSPCKSVALELKYDPNTMTVLSLNHVNPNDDVDRSRRAAALAQKLHATCSNFLK